MNTIAKPHAKRLNDDLKFFFNFLRFRETVNQLKIKRRCFQMVLPVKI